MAQDLAPLLTGATVTGAWWDWEKAVRHPAPEELRDRVTGRIVTGVGRRAKWLVVGLSSGEVLAIQVKMTGQLFVLPAGTPHDRHVHFRLDLDAGPVAGGTLHDGPRWLLFRDVRKFGRVGLYRQDEQGAILGADDAGELFGGHGPEPLDPAFTLRAFRERLRRRRGRLKPTITDQGFIAGVGNIYADESLWRARLHPLRSAGSLRPADERRLYAAIRDVLTEAVERRGSSVDDYTAPEGDGEMQHHLDVYQRTGQPCRRCGTAIRSDTFSEWSAGGAAVKQSVSPDQDRFRSTYWCPSCQREPKSARSARH